MKAAHLWAAFFVGRFGAIIMHNLRSSECTCVPGVALEMHVPTSVECVGYTAGVWTAVGDLGIVVIDLEIDVRIEIPIDAKSRRGTQPVKGSHISVV